MKRRGRLNPQEVWRHPVLRKLIELTLSNENPTSFDDYARQFPWIIFGATFTEEFIELEAMGIPRRCINQIVGPIDETKYLITFDSPRKVIRIYGLKVAKL